jgi:hypothetical protein
VRVLQAAAQFCRKALDSAGLGRAERARQPAGNRVDQNHRRQLAAGEHVRPDRDRIRGEVREHTLVEALEPSREQRQSLLLGKLLHDRLRQLAPLRAQCDDAVAGDTAVGGVERRRDHVDTEHHPCAASVRLVVDLSARKWCVVAVAEQAQLELVPEDGCKRSLFGQPRERMRNQGEDVELQREVRSSA